MWPHQFCFPRRPSNMNSTPPELGTVPITTASQVDKELDARIAVLLRDMKERPEEVRALLADFYYEGMARVAQAWRRDVL